MMHLKSPARRWFVRGMEMKMIGKTFFSGRGKGVKQSKGLDDLPHLLSLSSLGQFWGQGNQGKRVTGSLSQIRKLHCTICNIHTKLGRNQHIRDKYQHALCDKCESWIKVITKLKKKIPSLKPSREVEAKKEQVHFGFFFIFFNSI